MGWLLIWHYGGASFGVMTSISSKNVLAHSKRNHIKDVKVGK